MSDDTTTGALGFGVLLLLLLFYLGLIALSVYMYVRVARKAGYSGWWAAALFVPVANIVVMIMFAFVEWPIEREVKALRAARAGGFGHAAYAAVGAGGYSQPQLGQGQFGQSRFGQVAPPASQFGHSPTAGQFGAPTQSGYGPDPLPPQPVFGRPETADTPDQPEQKGDEPPSPYGAP